MTRAWYNRSPRAVKVLDEISRSRHGIRDSVGDRIRFAVYWLLVHRRRQGSSVWSHGLISDGPLPAGKSGYAVAFMVEGLPLRRIVPIVPARYSIRV